MAGHVDQCSHDDADHLAQERVAADLDLAGLAALGDVDRIDAAQRGPGGTARRAKCGVFRAK